MGNAGRVPKGVVLDEPMAKAVLFVATREGLLDNDPTIGDGFVRMLLSNQPPEQLMNDAFEQLVLGGRVFVPFWLPPQWKGELIEREILVSIDSPGESDLIEVRQMPAELVLGMLASRNLRWTFEELQERYHAFLQAYRAWEAVAAGKSFDGLEIRMALRKIMPIKEEEYTPEQLRKWQAVQDEYRRLRPVVDCVEAYRKVLTASIGASALSSLPILGSNDSPLEIGQVSDASERCTLLRITCKELRRVPIGSTLGETIRIATSPEAQALRWKLAEWSERLRQGDIEPAAVVLPEVERARKSLAVAKTLSRVGEYSTWVGVPTAIAGAFLTGPVGVGIGIGVSVVGGLALSGQKVTEGFNRWAMFGQK